MADEQNTYGKIAIAGDIAKIQHGMQFSDVDYFYYDNDFQILSAIKHYVNYKPFCLANSQQLKLDVDDQSCSWFVNDQEYMFSGFYNDGISTTTSAFMKSCYYLSAIYIPNYQPTVEKNKIVLVANCNYLDANDLEYVQTSAADYKLADCTFRNLGYRFVGWSKISAAAKEDIIPAGQYVAIDTNASFYANWIKQCNVAIQCYPNNNSAYVVQPKPIDGKYDLSAMLTVEALPDLHYDFDYWKIYDQIIESSSTSFQLSSENTEIDAMFMPHKYNLSVNVVDDSSNTTFVEYAYADGRRGKINPGTSVLLQTHFDEIELVAKDNLDSTFVMWNSENYPIAQLSNRVLAVKNLTADTIVNAVFGNNGAGVKAMYNKNFGSVKIKVGDDDYAERDYVAVPDGSVVKLSAIEKPGCKFVCWKNLTKSVSCDNAEYTLDNVLYLNVVSAYFDTWLIANDNQEPIMYLSTDSTGNIDDSMTKI